MQQLTRLTAVAGLALLLALVGCSRQPHTAGQLAVQWQYVRIQKDEKGQVQEIGNKHFPHGVGREVVLFEEGGLEVVEVSSARVRFRISGKDGEEQEVELEPGSSKDVWFKGGRSGVRIQVDKIEPAGGE